MSDSDIKNYRILKNNVFPKPFDQKGARIRLNQKLAAQYVTKGDIEEMGKTSVSKPPKAETEPKPAKAKKGKIDPLK